MGAPKVKDHRTDGWRSNWLKKKKEKKCSVTDAAQKAGALIMGLRRAAKKGKSFEVRKMHRKLATEREKEGGGDVAKIEKWTATMEAIKRIDLDVACAAACAAMPEMDDAMHRKLFPKNQPPPELPECANIVLQVDAVKEQLRLIAAAIDPKVAQMMAHEANLRKGKKKGKKGVEGSVGDSGEDEGEESGSDGEDVRRRRRLAAESMGSDDDMMVAPDSDDESDIENVDAMIGAEVKKNRPGQRTRRKLILQQHGKNAKVFQAEREKKRAERTAATAAPAAAAQDDKVHPSWAAKNKEKAAIAAALAGGGGQNRVRLDAQPPRAQAGGKPGGDGKPAYKSKKDKPLHPSWEAKKLAKEKQEKAAALVHNAAPRVHIKFDDDD